MYKITGFLGIILVVSTCHSGNEPYFDEYKWSIPPGLPGERLKDQPKVVTVCEYSGADTNRPDKKHLLYKRYTFNKQGDLILEQGYMSDKPSSQTQFEYDDNGMQSTTTSPAIRDSSWMICTSLGGGRYKTISRSSVRAARTWINTYSHNGQDFLQETYKDTLAQDKPLTTLHRYYQGTRLIRSISVSRHGTTDQHFYYSKGDSPDSVITEESGGSTSGGPSFWGREIYLNNSWGDPVLDYSISGKDTIVNIAIQYTYDQRGNWIKRIVTNLNKDSVKGVLNPNPYFEEREIQY